MNQLITEVFVEQPLASPGSANNSSGTLENDLETHPKLRVVISELYQTNFQHTNKLKKIMSATLNSLGEV